MKMTMKAMAEVNMLLNTLADMGVTPAPGNSNVFEYFAEDTDVLVSFQDGEELRWTVCVEHGAHKETWEDLCTKEVESVLNHVGLFHSVDLERIEEAYLMIKEYANPHISPREQAEELYQRGFYKEYWGEVDYLIKVYTFLQRPEWERGIQFDRVCKILQTISDEESWYEWKMDI